MAKAQIDIVLANGAKAGSTLKELHQTANRLNKEINNLKPGSEEFIKKTKDYQKVTARLKAVRDEVKGVDGAQKGLLSSFAQIIPFGGQIQNLTGKFGNFKSGVGGVTKGFRGLRGAIIATGIGALVILIGSLVSWLTKTQRGMEFVEKATAAVGAVFDVIIDRASMIIDGFKALFGGDTQKGFEILKNSVKGVGDEMSRDARLAWDLTEAMIALGKAETDFTLVQAQRKRQIQELIFLTRDETASFEERRKALLKATELELANQNRALELQRERVKLMEDDFERAESDEKDREKLIAERVKLEQLEAQSLSRQRELRNRINELDTKVRADQKKRHDARIKEIREEEKEQESANKESIADEKAMQQELDKLEKEEQDETKKGLSEIDQLRDKNLKRREQNHRNNLENIAIENDLQRIKIEELAAFGIITEEEKNAQLLQLEKNRLDAQLEEQKRFFGESSNEAQIASNKIRQLKLNEANFLNALEEDKKAKRRAAASGTLSFLSTIAGGVADLNEKDAEKQRKAQIAEAQISVFQAALNAYLSTVKIPIVGSVLAPIAAAAAFVFGQKKVEDMKNVKKARRGAVLRGPSHARGGIPIEAEGDEIILTAGVFRDPVGRAMASDLNARYGGIRFMESGGPVNPLSAQSVAVAASGVSGGATLQASDDMSAKMDILIGLFAEYPKVLQVHNNVQDTQRGIQVINDLEDDAGF